MLVLLCAITLAAAAGRWRLLDHPMRYDESYNYLNYASRSPGYIVTHYTPNNHVLHTLMVHVTSRFLGDHPAALRLPAFVGGVLLIPMTAGLAWAVSRRRFAVVLSALAVAGSSPLIEYSVNARGYSWLALFATLLAWLTLRLIRHPDHKRFWLLWALIAALGAYVVPVMILAVTGSFVALLIANSRTQPARPNGLRRVLGGGAIAAGVMAGFYLPIVLFEGLHKLLATKEMAYGILGGQIDSFGQMVLAAVTLAFRHAALPWIVLLLLGLAVYVYRAARRDGDARWTPLVIVATALALAAAMQAPFPARAWLFLFPILFACAADGLAQLAWLPTRRYASAALALVIAGVSIAGSAGILAHSRLCAEPGGLVEIESVLRDCQDFGAERCAVVSRYSPARAYYLRRLGAAEPAQPTSNGVRRVYIVADELRPLADLWGPHVDGYHNFALPRLSRTVATASLYLADRLPALTAQGGSGDDQIEPGP